MSTQKNQDILGAAVDSEWMGGHHSAEFLVDDCKASAADVLDEVGKTWGPCIALYQHGSSVWQNKEPADIDIIAVVDEPTLRPVFCASVDSQFKLGKFEVSVYTRTFWLQKLRLMDINMLTCLSLTQEFVLLENELFRKDVHSVCIRPQQLFEAGRSYAEFTWIKARTLLEQRELHKSSKNMSYVFRVLDIAAQILEHGRIIDFRAANCWWDRILDAYSYLAITSCDWDMVEALFARSFQKELGRVEALAGLSNLHSSSEHVEDQVCADVNCSEETCARCATSLACDDDVGSCIVLARCGHKLHRHCALEHCRAAAGVCTCPSCEVPWRLDLDKRVILQRDSDLRGTRQWLRVSRQKGRKNEDPRQLEHALSLGTPVTLETHARLLLSHAAYAKTKLARQAAFEDKRKAVRAACPFSVLERICMDPSCPLSADDETIDGDPVALVFAGYPPTALTIEEALALPARPILLTCEGEVVIGTDLSGDELFRIAANGETSAKDVQDLIGDKLGVSLGSIALLDTGTAIDADTPFGTISAPLVLLNQAADMQARFAREWARRKAGRALVEEHLTSCLDTCQALREECVLLRQKESEEREMARQQHIQNQKTLRGVVTRHHRPMALSRKADIEKQRIKARSKHLLRRSRLDEKRRRCFEQEPRQAGKRRNYRKNSVSGGRLSRLDLQSAVEMEAESAP